MSDGYGTEPMFPVPEKYRPPKAEPKYPAWREYKGKRISCDDCILALSRGEATFMSEPAKHVRIDKDSSRYFCSRHAYERQVAERRR